MEQHLLSSFLVTGVNYKKSNSIVRSKFALTKEQLKSLLNRAKLSGVHSLLVVSTCNRTEFYTYRQYHKTVVELLLEFTNTNNEDFAEHAYKKTAVDAVDHLLRVSTGLDSQILGDYEIVSQIKQSYSMAREAGTIDTFLDKHITIALQCSKKVKADTKISSGTTSVAFAAIQFLKENFASLKNKKILLVGTGKIGTHTCKNLSDYTDARSITLINRTDAKAESLATQLQLISLPFNQLSLAITDADIIIVSTADTSPVIIPSHLPANKAQLLIDLSIPNNIHADCSTLLNKRLVSVDELATINDATLAARRKEIPLAEEIIKEHVGQFTNWLRMRKHAHFISTMKHTLLDMEQCSIFKDYTKTQPLLFVQQPIEKKRQVTIKHLAENIKRENKGGCNVIEAINHFLTPCPII